jgi:hypothetical protein
MNENIETKSLGVDNSRVIRAFGQEAHVLVSSERTGDAFSVLRFFHATGQRYAAAPSSRDRIG